MVGIQGCRVVGGQGEGGSGVGGSKGSIDGRGEEVKGSKGGRSQG